MWSKMYIGIYVKYPLSVSDFNETWIFSTDFRKKRSSNIKFNEKPSYRSRIVPWGRTDGRAESQKERPDETNTVIPRLTSDPANEFFG